MRDFRNFDFWTDSKDLTREIYGLLQSYPAEERFALCDQIRRAVVSIPSNIAEGAGRGSDLDFCHFMDIALGSCYEVETQMEISCDLNYITKEQKNNIVNKLHSIERRLTAFIYKLRNRQ